MNSSDETYEGWANRETWLVALHVNNDQGWQESVHDGLLALVTEINEGRARETQVFPDVAGKGIRDLVEEMLGLDDEGPFTSDLLGCALNRADWSELGAAFLADIKDES